MRSLDSPRIARRADTTAVRFVSREYEGSRAVRDRTAVVVPPARTEVILVSPSVRCPLRGRHRMPVTPR
ncbi:hypothetical protein ACE1SV_54080 [Streptomyces sp. E-15]